MAMKREKFKIDWPTSIVASAIVTVLLTALAYAPGLTVLVLIGGGFLLLWRRHRIVGFTTPTWWDRSRRFHRRQRRSKQRPSEQCRHRHRPLSRQVEARNSKEIT